MFSFVLGLEQFHIMVYASVLTVFHTRVNVELVLCLTATDDTCNGPANIYEHFYLHYYINSEGKSSNVTDHKERIIDNFVNAITHIK